MMGGPGFEERVTRCIAAVLADGRSPYAARVVLAVMIADDAARSELNKPRAVLVAAYRRVTALAETEQIEAEKERDNAAANSV